MNLSEILAREYPMIIRPDHTTDGLFCYVAEHLDLPGCAAHGDTIAEATASLARARVAYLRHSFSLGDAPPEPVTTTEIIWQTGLEPASPGLIVMV